MKIELYIDGEKKLFATPFVPMLAKRKYLEIVAKSQEKGNEEYVPTAQEQLDEDDEMIGILSDVVFGGQFTLQQAYLGATNEYNYAKLREAVFGDKPIEEGTEKNPKGE